MLYERKALVEHEITKACDQAAKLYLHIVVSGGTPQEDQQYQQLKDSIGDLKYDLNMIDLLISQGHK